MNCDGVVFVPNKIHDRTPDKKVMLCDAYLGIARQLYLRLGQGLRVKPFKQGLP